MLACRSMTCRSAPLCRLHLSPADGDDGLLGADGPLHPHPVPHMPGEEGGDEAEQHVQGQLRVGQIEFKNSELLCSVRKNQSWVKDVK